MRLSRGAMGGIIGFVLGEHGPEHVSALAGQSDDGLDVMFSLAPLAVVVGPAFGMGAESTESTLIKYALELAIAPSRSSQSSGMARLAEHRGQPGCGRQGGSGAKSGDITRRGDELGCQNGPHAWQGAHEGGLRVGGDNGLELLIDPGQAVPCEQGFGCDFADQSGDHGLAWNGDALLDGTGAGEFG